MPIAGTLVASADFNVRSPDTKSVLTSDSARKLLEAAGWQWLRGDEEGDSSGRAWTEFGEIDRYGHNHGWRVAYHAVDQIRELTDRIRALLAAGSLFLVFSLALGLFISTLARNQFVAAQLAFLLTMMPAMMLSGMIFDIASMPGWLQVVTYVVPARYLVTILQSLFLAGTVWPLMLPNLAGLGVAATLAVLATVAVTRRRLD